MLDRKHRQEDFPSLEGMTYLNTAAEGIPPVSVDAALREYFLNKQMGMGGREAHRAQREAVRSLVGEMYGLSPREIGLCSCVSEAFNLAALALRLKEGDEVVINELDFPAGTTPWLLPSCQASVKLWRARGGALRLEDLMPLLGPKTRLVTASLVSFYNGFMLNAASLVEAVRKASPALVALDVTQALGRVRLDLRGVDLIVSSSYKWILGSHGGGLVGIPDERAEEWTVPAGGWYQIEDPFGPDRFLRARSRPGADSFGVGMPSYAAIYAIRAGLEYIRWVGVERIEQATSSLVEACLSGLERLPVELITPREEGAVAGIIAFRHHALERINRFLQEKGIHVMQEAGRMRVSIHGYNSIEDVETFLRNLEEALTRLG